MLKGEIHTAQFYRGTKIPNPLRLTRDGFEEMIK